MLQAVGQLSVRTRRTGLLDITGQVSGWIDQQAVGDGLVTLFCRHTSASLLINENAAPAVRRDLQRYF